ncbi:hypothetical protein ACTA71_010317 [Dictyostelium dimigraforme]
MLLENLILKESKTILINGDLTYFIIHIVLIFLFLLLFIFTIIYKKENVYEEGDIEIKYIGEVLYILYIFGTMLLISFISSLSLFLLKVYDEGTSYQRNIDTYEYSIKVFNVVMYIFFTGMILYELLFSFEEMKSINIPYSITQKSIQLILALIYCSIGLSLGITLIRSDNGYYWNSFSIFKYKYAKIIIIGLFYFLIRSIFTTISILTPIEPLHGIFETVFYFVFEIIPVSLILWVTKTIDSEASELKEFNEEPDSFSQALPII